jgi:hypothetical protein
MSRALPVPVIPAGWKTSFIVCPDLPGMMPPDLLVVAIFVY